MTDHYVQYGCGFTAPPGWINFDASPTLRFERIPVIGRLYTKNAARFPENVRYGDIVKGLPLEPESCVAIYCSHVLEHLALDEANDALANTHRYLKKGGTFRLVVPDLFQLASEYLGAEDADAAHRFVDATGLGRRQRQSGLVARVRDALGHSAHLWMWDEKAMAEALGRHGFSRIRRCYFGDAADARFREVEDEGRFAGCLGMECIK